MKCNWSFFRAVCVEKLGLEKKKLVYCLKTNLKRVWSNSLTHCSETNKQEVILLLLSLYSFAHRPCRTGATAGCADSGSAAGSTLLFLLLLVLLNQLLFFLLVILGRQGEWPGTKAQPQGLQLHQGPWQRQLRQGEWRRGLWVGAWPLRVSCFSLKKLILTNKNIFWILGLKAFFFFFQ